MQSPKFLQLCGGLGKGLFGSHKKSQNNNNSKFDSLPFFVKNSKFVFNKNHLYLLPF